MPNGIMYCTHCGAAVGPDEKACPKCKGHVFTNVKPKGKVVPEPGGLIGAFDSWTKTGKPPDIW